MKLLNKNVVGFIRNEFLKIFMNKFFKDNLIFLLKLEWILISDILMLKFDEIVFYIMN